MFCNHHQTVYSNSDIKFNVKKYPFLNYFSINLLFIKKV